MRGCSRPTDVFKPVRWLMGRWRSVSAKVSDPEVFGADSVDFLSNLNFLQCGVGSALEYESRARHATDGHVLYHEKGFLKLMNYGGDDSDEHQQTVFCYTRHSGMVALAHGHVEDGKKLSLVATSSKIIQTTQNNNEESQITRVENRYRLKGKLLSFQLFVQTPAVPLTEILTVMYQRNSCDPE